MSTSENKINEISQLLLEYSAGNYQYQGVISDDGDELDMIISGINMLGEELESTNVSRDYFSSIFNAVTDLVLVLGENGEILDANHAVEKAFETSLAKLQTKKLDDLLVEDNIIFDDLKIKLDGGMKSITIENELHGVDGSIIFGLFSCVRIIDRFDIFKGYLISIKDITEQKQNENLILKIVFTTQQKEQRRVADDLHDSIGQELSMTKMMISNMRKHAKNNPKTLDLIETCTEILDNSIQHVREICYDLMPSVLLRGGLNMAIADLCKKLEAQDHIAVKFIKNRELDRLDSDLEIVMYRIVQEFINNMIKHSKATTLEIQLMNDTDSNIVSLHLSENGQGFDLKKLDKIGDNRGYSNLRTKVKAFNGFLKINSKIGHGTSTFVKFPKLPYNEED